MKNKFEYEIEKIMQIFWQRNVKVTISGLIECKFYMQKLNYKIDEEILTIEACDDIYLDIDLDDVQNIYLEYKANNYAILVFRINKELQIELETKQSNIIFIKNTAKNIDKTCKNVIWY